MFKYRKGWPIFRGKISDLSMVSADKKIWQGPNHLFVVMPRPFQAYVNTKIVLILLYVIFTIIRAAPCLGASSLDTN